MGEGEKGKRREAIDGWRSFRRRENRRWEEGDIEMGEGEKEKRGRRQRDGRE